MALTELVNGTKLPKQIISTALGVSRLHDALWSGYRHFYEEIKDTDDDNEDPYAHFPMTTAWRYCGNFKNVPTT